MNIQSIILLGIVLAVFFLVGYRHLQRQRKNPGCGSCNCSDCESCNTLHQSVK